MTYPTSIGTSDETSITLLGHDLPTELMGQISFSDLAYWLITTRRPTPGQSRLFEAVLVTLADHGLTPTVLAARLTLHGAPESVQGAMAAGLLGGGSRFLGVTEDVARFLSDGAATMGDAPTQDELDGVATELVDVTRARGEYIPGLGHPVHKDGDPRTPVLYRLAAEEGVLGPCLSLLEAIDRVHGEILGRRLPVNGAGVCGAVLVDIGIPPALTRGVSLLARSAGVLGHLAEEMRRPIGQQLYAAVDRNIEYLPLSTDTTSSVGPTEGGRS